MSGVIFHLTTAPEWEAALRAGAYRADSLAREGFIHCSHLEQVERVARARYRGTRDLVILAVDPTGLDVRDEQGDPGSDERFPHVYGEIPVTAVGTALPFPVNDPERCDECGFDGAEVWPEQAAAFLNGLGAEWKARTNPLTDEQLRTRPADRVWSPLEYAAHSRDVTALVGWAMREVLEGRTLPEGPTVDVDEVAETARYNELDPATVMDELAANAQRVARHARRAHDIDWFRSAPVDGTPTIALDALRHIVHDAAHHLMDVDRWKTTQSDRR